MFQSNKFSNKRRVLLKTTAQSMLAWPLLSTVARAAEQPVVETANGKVRGFRNDDVFTFRGLRYGAHTGGENRFMPPRAPEAWSGIHDASSYGYSAPQTDPSIPQGFKAPSTALTDIFGASNGYRASASESEDCLFLNIWSTSLARNSKKPVMVWLHGGGFATGSASELLYDGTNLASNHDVVVVGVNHRLNVFGYTHLAELGGADYANSGNAGQLDIIQALQWVKDNIESFGGDPDRVLVFGESGGGAKISFLLGSPAAKGLFHRAIVESGPGITMGLPEEASAASELLLEELSISSGSIGDLHTRSTEQILQAYFNIQSKLPPGGLGGGAFGPVLTPDVLPAHPFEPVASSISADVPVIVGWNRTEATLFQLGDQAAFNLDQNELRERIQGLLGDKAATAIEAYSAPGLSPTDVYFRIASDQMFGVNSILLAERKSQLGKAPVYLYRFDWESPMLDGMLRSPHGLEMPFVFDNTDAGGFGLTGGSDRARKLATSMSATWAAFAASGDPNAVNSGLPLWNPYDMDDRSTMIFNDQSRVENDPDSDERLAMTG